MTDERTATTTGPRALQAVLIGGSAGALEVVSLLLGGLPRDLAPTLAIVLHQPRRGPGTLGEALRGACPLALREPQDKEPLAPSTVYVAPPDYHLLLDPGPSFSLSVDEPVSFSRPSIDVLFESAADVLGPRCAAILLSGASSDGARGLQAIHQAGGLAVVQAPEEAAHRTMPEAALAICPGARVLAAIGIRRWLQQLSANPTGPRGRGAP